MRRAAAALALLLSSLLCGSAAGAVEPPDQPSDEASPDPAPPAQAPSWPNGWEPRGTADIAALDKLSAQPAKLAIRVGGSASFRTLTIAVRSCLVRPPDQPADAAAYLDVTDSHPNSPDFHGWMLAGEPGLTVFQSPLYDVRLLGCR